MRFAIVLAMVLTGCAGSFERHARYAATAAVIGLIACDVGQTYKDADGGRWDIMPAPGDRVVEGNPVLGQEPPPGLLVLDFELSAALTAWVGTKTPRWVAWTYLGIVGAVETYIVTAPEHLKWSGGPCGV